MNQNIEHQSFYLALEKTKTSTVSSLAAAVLFSSLIYLELQSLSIVPWLAFMLFQLAARQAYASYLLKTFNNHLENVDDIRKKFGFFIFISAASWGALGPLFILTQVSDLVTMLTVIFVIGILAGTIFSLSNVPSYFYLFTTVLSVPIIISFMMINEWAAAFTVLGFLFYTILSSRDVRASVLKNLELNIKNVELIDDLKQANKLKGEFLANMSHEIRTPMNAILGFLQILKEDEKEPTKLDYLNTIGRSGEDLLQIINDILDFSKIESDQVQFEKVAFNPQERLNQSIKLYTSYAEQKQVNILVNASPDLPALILSDPTRFSQILNNLLSNAIKFSKPQAEVQVLLSYEKETQKLRVTIKDQGIGIAQQKLAEIFKPFTQADNSTTREYGGTGLGLSISNRLTEKMGGEITVSSKEGQGSEFSFYIPTPQIKQSREISVKDTQSEATNLKGHVLVVEDNKTNQLLVSKLLEKFGLTYDIANDGIEGVQSFKKKHYDLILMDENMPNKSGIEATKEIRELETELKTHIPIIALTANAMQGDRERFIEAGMDEYLAKPINLSKFKQTLKLFLP